MSFSFHSLGQKVRWLPFAILLGMSINLPAASPPPLPPPKPAGPLFRERPFGPTPPPTEAPPRHFQEEEKPIPRSWIIGGAAGIILVVGLTLYGSARAWRSSNIFDQQYRFPVNSAPAFRLGGQRSGGHMATIRAGEAATAGPRGLTKDA